MSNLEPRVNNTHGYEKRSQLAKFMSGDSPEAAEVVAAANEALDEYKGFIDRIARQEGRNDDEAKLETAIGVETVARFAVWRALVNRENQEGDKE
jgi:hypothetical protein